MLSPTKAEQLCFSMHDMSFGSRLLVGIMISELPMLAAHCQVPLLMLPWTTDGVAPHTLICYSSPVSGATLLRVQNVY